MYMDIFEEYIKASQMNDPWLLEKIIDKLFIIYNYNLKESGEQ